MKKKNTEHPLTPDTYFNIYNRGINGENIFKNEGNYAFFLQRYAHYISPVANTYSYALLGNHFHFLVRIHSEATIRANLLTKQLGVIDVLSAQQKSIAELANNQFAKLFNSYAQAINKQNERTGSLFERSFRRVAISTNEYLLRMVYYIHYNPQKHGFVADFRDYPHTSYPVFGTTQNTRIPRQEVFEWFGGKSDFFSYHQLTNQYDRNWCDTYWIEED